MSKNVLLLKGGGGTEHEVSLISAKYLESQIKGHTIFSVELTADKKWLLNNEEVFLDFKKQLIKESDKTTISNIDFAIPCFHGYPGETGEIAAFFDLIKLPYMGCNNEASIHCFNKITTKLWMHTIDVPTVPFVYATTPKVLGHVVEFFEKHNDLFIKASNQGSSVGCYQAKTREELDQAILKAFNYSPYVLVEKTVKARELEIAVFEYKGDVFATKPGEIVCPDGFYDYEEKYSNDSKTETKVEAELDEQIITQMRAYAIKAFKVLGLRHLSRIDFFLTSDGEIYLNEINTFPGHTPISMFPTMMENYGVKYSDYIADIISNG